MTRKEKREEAQKKRAAIKAELLKVMKEKFTASTDHGDRAVVALKKAAAVAETKAIELIQASPRDGELIRSAVIELARTMSAELTKEAVCR